MTTSLDDRRQRHDHAMQQAFAWPAGAPWIRAAIAATSRDQYTPDRIWTLEGDQFVPIDRGRDPERWASLVYASPETSTITQVADSVTTSNLIATAVVADMLDHLDLEPGHRVLELGTGTGWLTALMTRRTGANRVITLEIDPELATGTRERLHHHGVHARVENTDGLAGWPAGAPYDRVVATFEPRGIPWAWGEQTRPGGLIVSPWRRGLVPLIVDDEGISASGRVQQATQFIPARDTLPAARAMPRTWQQIRSRTNTAHQQRVIDRDLTQLQRSEHLLWALSVLLPDVWVLAHTTIRGLVVTLHDGDASWALLNAPPTGGPSVAFEGGPRRLADELEEAWDAWLSVGSPTIYSFGVTVTAGRQWAWQDNPTNGPWDPR
ncbi:rRNA adenine N-6-methyltransferase family protein [Streptomyces hainanensis]|uniref:Protein-L-isoaspartate O-methyltransferase n=1 Tax=Streptomyces hainanensis TaxID=402648 RepID=A0A4R4TIK6_9ACTN|nr:rRNA adenine N-6-methyltransferase family protein [Streptomyces hainanensis]TDC77497.1 methyltransferase domain-containing protein [Streptomyces hainanensis]